ncbi:MAG: acyltransferase [Undibacterium sp.]|nr:acyltransferase [Undibacterium sp.]
MPAAIATTSRQNNFDFLRILAAFLVLFGHQLALGGETEITILPNISLGTLGVFMFFIISGFLVSSSWRNDPHTWRFLAKRLLRLWPGLAVVVLLAALVMGPLMSNLSATAYFSSPSLLRYLHTLHFNIQYYLPGVFTNNPYPGAVNGSLWTIPLELNCYLMLLSLGLLRCLRWPLLVLIATLATATTLLVFQNQTVQLKWHFSVFFFAGVCLDLFQPQWRKFAYRYLLGLTCLSLLLFVMHFPEAGLFAILPYAVIFFGSSATPLLRKTGKYGDLSYGLYLYAFPIQQLFFSLNGKALSFYLGLVITLCFTFICAYASWHLIEKPALSLKPGAKI